MERDALGELPVPDEAYYGIQTVRCVANHNVSDRTFNDLPTVVRALAEVKKACALTNEEIGFLDSYKAKAIIQACDEVIAGRFPKDFPINVWRGHGTGANMNINEVVANRANEILTGHKGYDAVHPNNDVNMCQSSNDVYPTVTSIVLYRGIGRALEGVRKLEDALGRKALQYKDVVRLGRTCLQDAVPMTFGQLFGGWQAMIHRNRLRLEAIREDYRSVVLGATILGTGMGQLPGYQEKVLDNLSRVVGFEVRNPVWEEGAVKDSALFDAMQNCDGLLILSGTLKVLAAAASRICVDLALLSSGPRAGFGEIRFEDNPLMQRAGGAEFSVLPEYMTEIMQTAVAVDAATLLTVNENDGDEAINDGATSFMGALEVLELIECGFALFAEEGIDRIVVNVESVREKAERSTSLATMVSSLFGYKVGTAVARKAWKENITCREAALSEGLLSREVADDLFDLKKLTEREAMVDMFRRYRALRHVEK
jgi:aspartate ammonia-lyase